MPSCFPAYAADAELRGDIRLQPVIFFRELLMNDLSLLNLVDSKFTITTKKLQKLYGSDVLPPKRESSNPASESNCRRVAIAAGFFGYARRFWWFLRIRSAPVRSCEASGCWTRSWELLRRRLRQMPPLKSRRPPKPRTVRELLTQHRADPVCASCHSRIDPLGFALENYDALGVWRNTDAGQAVDASGELPDGTRFEGPAQLKRILLEKKSLFFRNLTNKMLGYALGRGLNLRDSCVVNDILAHLEAGNFSAQTLIQAVVLSMPFRYQAGTIAAPAQVSPKARE